MIVILHKNSTSFVTFTTLHLQFHIQLLIKIKHANHKIIMLYYFKP